MKNAKVHAFLDHHPLGTLSTVSVTGEPWGSAVYYVADEDFTIYFVTRAETFKYHNISGNHLAALTVADDNTQTTVQLTGVVSALPVQRYMDVFLEKFSRLRPQNNYQWAPPIEKIHHGNYMPLQLSPTKLQYANFSPQRTEPYSDYIERVIP